jgi:hypothetical protein
MTPDNSYMIETKFFFQTFEPPTIGPNSISFSAPVWMQAPEFIAMHGEGWVPVNHTYYANDGQMFVSIMSNREISVPDSPE